MTLINLPADDQIMNVDEAAAYLRVTKVSLYKQLKNGTIPHARVGHAYRMKKSHLDELFYGHYSRENK